MYLCIFCFGDEKQNFTVDMSIVWQTEIKNYKRQRTKTIDSATLDDHVTQRFQKNFVHQSKLANNLIWFRVKEYKLQFIRVARYAVED